MVSVIIPLYNKAHTIVNTLTTVVHQTYKDFEVIIVNDGSTDNGVEVINTNFNDPRIRIINQENAGVSAARNRGANEAKGEWLAFLDADDEWMPLYLETLLRVLNGHPQAVMIGCASYHKNYKTGKVSANAIIDKYYGKAVHINYFINPDKMPHIGATILKRESFLQTEGFDTSLKYNEDVLLLGTIAMHGYFVYVGQCLHVYVGNVEGQATSNASNGAVRVKNQTEVLNKFYALYTSKGQKNKLVSISIKYRGRHLFLGLLKCRQYDLLALAQKQLLPALQWIFGIKAMCMPRLRGLCILYIYATKLIWRLHGFPIVGSISKYNLELTETYYKNHEQSDTDRNRSLP